MKGITMETINTLTQAVFAIVAILAVWFVVVKIGDKM